MDQQSQKMESIGMLAGGISHGFNNILTSIIGYTKLALDNVEKDSRLNDNLQQVYTAGKRAKDLIRQILTFARQTEDEVKPIMVDAIAKEVLNLFRSAIPATIEIRQHIESDFLIMGDPTQVHQVIMNLCSNVAVAIGADGSILTVELRDVRHDEETPERSDSNIVFK